MVYLLGAAVVCILQASKEGGNSYRVMLFSIIITYGSWAASGLLAFDPWHMITCIFQYLLLSPFYVNLLNMYVLQLGDLAVGSDHS
jgi:chitin synthase